MKLFFITLGFLFSNSISVASLEQRNLLYEFSPEIIARQVFLLEDAIERKKTFDQANMLKRMILLLENLEFQRDIRAPMRLFSNFFYKQGSGNIIKTLNFLLNSPNKNVQNHSLVLLHYFSKASPIYFVDIPHYEDTGNIIWKLKSSYPQTRMLAIKIIVTTHQFFKEENLLQFKAPSHLINILKSTNEETVILAITLIQELLFKYKKVNSWFKSSNLVTTLEEVLSESESESESKSKSEDISHAVTCLLRNLPVDFR